jgi:protease I
MDGVLVMAKILMVVAQRDFRDEEFLVPKEMLLSAGHTIKVASVTRMGAKGVKGTTLTPDMAIHEASADFFDCILVVGGPGSYSLADNKDLLLLLSRADKAGKYVCGICVGPLALAKAGVLAGKEATIFPDMAIIKTLRDSGATYNLKHVVSYGNVVTADGPAAAAEFAKAVAAALKENPS